MIVDKFSITKDGQIEKINGVVIGEIVTEYDYELQDFIEFFEWLKDQTETRVDEDDVAMLEADIENLQSEVSDLEYDNEKLEEKVKILNDEIYELRSRLKLPTKKEKLDNIGLED